MLLAQEVKGAQLGFIGLILILMLMLMLMLIEVGVERGLGEERVGSIGGDIIEEDYKERENGEEVFLFELQLASKSARGRRCRCRGMDNIIFFHCQFATAHESRCSPEEDMKQTTN